MNWFVPDPAGWRLTLHIQPGAKKTELAGLYGEALKIRLAAPPVDGKANKALCDFLATVFRVPVRQIEILAGDASRQKRVLVRGSRVMPAELLVD